MAELLEPPWLRKARREVGVAEVPGAQANPRIVEYFKCVTYHATSDEIPWCAAFVSAMLEWSGVESTKSAAAKSYLTWGVPVEKPTAGSIVVTERQGGYHVGLYLHETPDRITLLGGNQSDKVCEASFPKSLVKAYRMPDEEHWAPEDDPDKENLL